MTQEEYKNLVDVLKMHDYHYWVENNPVLEDYEYDSLYMQAQQYEHEHPEHILPDSPTQKLSEDIRNGHRQIRRRTPMLSTQKAQQVDQVVKWMEKTSRLTGENLYTVEWKYDGVSCSLVYLDGILAEASYGKGIEGNDCLNLIQQIPSVPQQISENGRVEVRGEVVCPLANLSKTSYKNCRSAAAGILADTESTMGNLLEFYPYWISEAKQDTTTKALLRLNDLGFKWSIIDPIGADSIEEYVKRMADIRAGLEFPVDGLVIKVTDMNKWDSLGATEHHPNYSMAFKFAAATAETTITRIDVTVGKTGKRTPVAYFKPVVINGATYQKASVGSEKKLTELGIQVGSRVLVSLRNDVIPHIDKVITDEQEQIEEPETITETICSVIDVEPELVGVIPKQEINCEECQENENNSLVFEEEEMEVDEQEDVIEPIMEQKTDTTKTGTLYVTLVPFLMLATLIVCYMINGLLCVFAMVCMIGFYAGYYIGRCRGAGVPVGSPDEESILAQARHWQNMMHQLWIANNGVIGADYKWAASDSSPVETEWVSLLKLIRGLGLELHITRKE